MVKTYFFSPKVVCCVSWPIPYKNPLRKLFFNVGFQFNYGEPFRPSNFYNATYFQNPFGGSRDLKDETSNSTAAESVGEPRSLDGSNEIVGSDLTAGQLYESIEDNFKE